MQICPDPWTTHCPYSETAKFGTHHAATCSLHAGVLGEACRRNTHILSSGNLLLQSWLGAEAGGEAEEVAGGVEEGDPMLMVKAAMSLERSLKSDQRWVRSLCQYAMAPWRSLPMALCLSSSNP